MIRLFVPLEVYPKRRHIFPLLKPFQKVEGYSDTARIQHYGISEKDVSFVDTLEASDYVVLPMSWNFYIAESKISEVENVIAAAASKEIKVLSFMVGDFGVKLKSYDNVLLFRHSGERSKLSENHQGYPVFIEDPLAKHFNTTQIKIRPYNPTPIVGFCGQATISVGNAVKEYGKTLGRNLKSKLGASNLPAQQVLSTSYVRASVLKTLEDATGVTTNFIYRKKYRAGAITEVARKQTTQEFYDNMQESDYVVCVRGAGNFSVRFYEALAMGRIPVFVDTDCLLPLNEIIQWQKHVVWVSYKDRDAVAGKVKQFHSNLSSKQFEALQVQNRKLWLEKMNIGGFFKSYLSE